MGILQPLPPVLEDTQRSQGSQTSIRPCVSFGDIYSPRTIIMGHTGMAKTSQVILRSQKTKSECREAAVCLREGSLWYYCQLDTISSHLGRGDNQADM